MTTVRMLSRYARKGASSRLRMFQFAPYLEKIGMAVEQSPLLDDAYLEQMYSGKRSVLAVAKSYLERVKQLAKVTNEEVLWIEKEAFPWLPWLVERSLLPRGASFVADYDDAIFHQYDLHRSPIVRLALARKIDMIMKSSALVFAGNLYLAGRAQAAGARRVEIVPTVVDIDLYRVRNFSLQRRDLRIGWIGTSSTWAEYMAPIMPMLAQVASSQGARVIAVGAGQSATEHPLLDNLAWSEEHEVSVIQRMDVGIMPLTDTPWARGKCGYKLIQYMACGIPVVASPVGVNREIVEHGVNGFLAETPEDWTQALRTLLSDTELRHKMGMAGRMKVERSYSLQVYGPKVASLLHDLAESAGRMTR